MKPAKSAPPLPPPISWISNFSPLAAWILIYPLSALSHHVITVCFPGPLQASNNTEKVHLSTLKVHLVLCFILAVQRVARCRTTLRERESPAQGGGPLPPEDWCWDGADGWERSSPCKRSCMSLSAWLENELHRSKWVTTSEEFSGWLLRLYLDVHPPETLDTSNAASAKGFDKWRMGWLYPTGS